MIIYGCSVASLILVSTCHLQFNESSRFFESAGNAFVLYTIVFIEIGDHNRLGVCMGSVVFVLPPIVPQLLILVLWTSLCGIGDGVATTG